MCARLTMILAKYPLHEHLVQLYSQFPLVKVIVKPAPKGRGDAHERSEERRVGKECLE